MDDLRKNLSAIRRSLWPTREMIGNILKGILPLVSDQNIAYFRDVYDHLAQLIDLVEVCHNRVNNI
jgi:magnesium transporter